MRLAAAGDCVGIDRSDRSAMTLPIEDYALIGDCKTAAVVGRDETEIYREISGSVPAKISWIRSA